MDMVQRIAAKAVIVKDGKVLILREAATYGDGTQQGRYHLPGGRVEIGERFEEALRREVLEETGLHINIGDPLYVGEWRPVIKGVPNQIIGIFSICTPGSDTVTLSSEHDDYQWVDPANHAGYDVMEPEVEVLEQYVARTAKAIS
jgi:8-oxo-dGTP diphosphatase